MIFNQTRSEVQSYRLLLAMQTGGDWGERGFCSPHTCQSFSNHPQGGVACGVYLEVLSTGGVLYLSTETQNHVVGQLRDIYMNLSD